MSTGLLFVKLVGFYCLPVLLVSFVMSLLLFFKPKDRDEPRDRQGAVHKIKIDAATARPFIFVETDRNLNIRLTEHKIERASRNGEISNHIAENHLQTNYRIDWDSVKCVNY